jgi:hypothetical protein
LARLFLCYCEGASVGQKPFGKKGRKEMVRDRSGNQHSKETKMNNSVLRSPVLWGFLILMFVSLWSTNLVWAAPDPSPLRQTVPPHNHYVFLPLIEKNYPTSSSAANSTTGCLAGQPVRSLSDVPSMTNDFDRGTMPRVVKESIVCISPPAK